jgi:hypothetical protein
VFKRDVDAIRKEYAQMSLEELLQEEQRISDDLYNSGMSFEAIQDDEALEEIYVMEKQRERMIGGYIKAKKQELGIPINDNPSPIKAKTPRPVFQSSAALWEPEPDSMLDAVRGVVCALRKDWLPERTLRLVSELEEDIDDPRKACCPQSRSYIIGSAFDLVRIIYYDEHAEAQIMADAQIEERVKEIPLEELAEYSRFLDAALAEGLMQAVAEQDVEGFDTMRQEMSYRLKLINGRIMAEGGYSVWPNASVA